MRTGIIAAAGSGKTTTIVKHITGLVNDGVDPEAICCFTFTVAAAKELKLRLGEIADAMYVGTFHSIASSFLPARTVLDEHGVAVIAKHLLGDKIGRKVAKEFTTAKSLSERPAVLNAYFLQYNLIDYYGLLLSFLATLQSGTHPLLQCKHILVDEAQDTDWLQWAIVDELCRNADGLFVGDPRQSIYQWRGARYEDFISRCDNKQYLSSSYRFCQQVADVSDHVVNTVFNDLPSTTGLGQGSGAEVHDSLSSALQCAHAEFWTPGEVGVLCRKNEQIPLAEEAVASVGWSCLNQTAASSSLGNLLPLMQFLANPNEATAIAALDDRWARRCQPYEFVHHLSNKNYTAAAYSARAFMDYVSVNATVKAVFTALGIGHTYPSASVWLTKYGHWTVQAAVADCSYDRNVDRQSNHVTVSTIHGAKGLEYPLTILWLDDDPAPNSEDYRVAYVGLTRCKDKCMVVRCDNPIFTKIEECIQKKAQPSLNF